MRAQNNQSPNQVLKRHFLSKEYIVSLYPCKPQTKNIVLVNVTCNIKKYHKQTNKQINKQAQPAYRLQLLKILCKLNHKRFGLVRILAYSV